MLVGIQMLLCRGRHIPFATSFSSIMRSLNRIEKYRIPLSSSEEVRLVHLFIAVLPVILIVEPLANRAFHIQYIVWAGTRGQGLDGIAVVGR